MANGILIPITVDFKNSLQKLNDTRKAVDGLGTDAAKTLKILATAPSTGGLKAVADNTQSVKTQLRQANVELQNLILKFGAASPQVQAAAARVEELGDVVEDARRATEAADFAGKFALAGKSISTIASAFQTATALQAVFGDKSKETEEALKKVQAVMALTQGIQGIVEGSKALATLGATGAKAFSSLVAGIVSATGATSALAAAIAATGIGLLVVGIGLAVPKLIELFSSTKNAAQAVNNLSAAEKKLGDDLERTNRQIDLRNQALDFANKQAVLQARIAGKTQEDINKAEASSREKGIKDAIDDRNKANKAFLDAQKSTLFDLATIRREGSDEEIKNAEEQANKLLAKLKDDALKKKDLVVKLENDAQLAGLEVQADAADKEREEQKKRLEDQLKKQKEFAQKRADAIRLNEELRAATTSAIEQKIFNINRDFEDKKKKLIEGGITDFTALNAARAKAILDVETQANNERLQAQSNLDKAFENIIVAGLQRFVALRQKGAELSQRAALSGIKNEYDRRDAEIKNAEQTEIDALNKSYGDKKEDYEQYWIDLANIRKYYQGETDKNNQDRNKKEEDDLKTKLDNQKQILASGIADAASAFGEALGAGENPFQAAFKSLASSLGGYLQQLGKDAILASKLIAGLKKLIGTPKGLVAGIALVVLGAALKAAFSKKSEKGFATGGFVSGPGTETSDSIPARLSRGEYVINARAVRRLGKGFFDGLNNNSLNGFANGGFILPSFGQMSNPAMPRMSATTEPQIIATTKVSGQDLKIILERADKRYLSVT